MTHLVMVQDKDIDSPEVAALAAQAADLLTRAHAAAVEDAANSQRADITSGESHTPALYEPSCPLLSRVKLLHMQSMRLCGQLYTGLQYRFLGDWSGHTIQHKACSCRPCIGTVGPALGLVPL